MHDHLGLIVAWSAPGTQRSQKPIESFLAGCPSHTNDAGELAVGGAAVLSTMRVVSKIILFRFLQQNGGVHPRTPGSEPRFGSVAYIVPQACEIVSSILWLSKEVRRRQG
jgi:hypothetical protein